MATKSKIVREKKLRLYVIVKQTLLAFMNGAMPQVALEHGRKTISAYERPSIDEVEQETLGGGGAAADAGAEGGCIGLMAPHEASSGGGRRGPEGDFLGRVEASWIACRRWRRRFERAAALCTDDLREAPPCPRRN